MKVSGDMMRVLLITTIAVVFVFSNLSKAVSGNKWMMEKNRDELLMLNTELLERLGKLEKDGEIVLKGSVVFRNGKTIIRIRHLQKYTSAPEKADELLEGAGLGAPYKVFLREMPLPEVQVVDVEKEDEVSENKKK